jgi:hypothetical protein
MMFIRNSKVVAGFTRSIDQDLLQVYAWTQQCFLSMSGIFDGSLKHQFLSMLGPINCINIPTFTLYPIVDHSLINKIITYAVLTL